MSKTLSDAEWHTLLLTTGHPIVYSDSEWDNHCRDPDHPVSQINTGIRPPVILNQEVSIQLSDTKESLVVVVTRAHFSKWYEVKRKGKCRPTEISTA